MPLYKQVTIPMKLKGVFVDINYFEKLKKELECAILSLEEQIWEYIREDIQPFVKQLLDKSISSSKSGKFAEQVLQYYKIPTPINRKTGKPTFAKNALQHLLTTYPESEAVKWLTQSDFELNESALYSIKKKLWIQKKPDLPEVFNLSSTKHLAWLLFEHHGCKPKSFSKKTGAPAVNKDSLDDYGHLPFVKIYENLRKQEKILSTYILPVLALNVQGWIYPSMQQFGTVSGRYSCRDPNLQNLPRDDTRIKKGFVAPKGYKIVGSDFSSLEPRIFSWVSKDKGLKETYQKGLDLYSQIAIDVFGLMGVSADPKSKKYLGTVDKKYRQRVKEFALMIPYGADAYRVSYSMGISIEEAATIRESYLQAYPGLVDYMKTQEKEVKEKGYVKTQFGRTRHMPRAKLLYSTLGKKILNRRSMKEIHGEEGSFLYSEFRNYINNSKNFPIQATAAHVTNAALLKLVKLFNENNIQGWPAMQVHDEIICIVKEEDSEKAAELLQSAMEDNSITKQIDIPMIAEPVIGDNFSECK
jgi:DNA polymerase-1